MDCSEYPVLALTPEEYDAIPRAQDLPSDFLETCDLGTHFKCTDCTSIDDMVIGVLVRGADALCNQYGAGLSVPERFVNRYRPEIIGYRLQDS